MSTGLTHIENSIELRRAAEDRRTDAARFVLPLTALGMIASLLAMVSFQEVRAQLTQQMVPTAVARSQLYYAAHGAEILLLMAAGVMALRSTNWRQIESGYFARFALFIGATLLMTGRGYTASELVSTKLFDWTGPFPCLMSVLVFVGARRTNWNALSKAMVILAGIFSFMVLLGVAGLSALTRAEAVAKLAAPLNALFWPASWIALREYPRGSLARRLHFLPMLIYALGSFFTLTRLNVVMMIAFLGVYAWVQHQRRIPQGAGWVLALTMAALVSLFAAIFLRNTSAFERVEDVGNAFASRLSDDTRTGQLIWFSDRVQPAELLLGRGSLATWYWGATQYTGGTDVGYLTLLFYGGLPLLLTYIAAHLAPCLKILRRNPSGLQLASAGVVFLWAIRMLSSSYPGFGLDYYPILFCVGACIFRGSNPPQWRRCRVQAESREVS